MKCLRANKTLQTSSKLNCARPWLDEEGVIRSNSRLSEAIHVLWDTRFPLILPRKHRVTFLVVTDLHVQSGHGGTSMVMTRVTAQFWMPSQQASCPS